MGTASNRSERAGRAGNCTSRWSEATPTRYRCGPMSRRIEIELTSARPDGTWTWRAAGAGSPRGVLDGSLLPAGAKIGSVLKADAEVELDGITILVGDDHARRRPRSPACSTSSPATSRSRLSPSNSPSATATTAAIVATAATAPSATRRRLTATAGRAAMRRPAARDARAQRARDRPAGDRPSGERRPELAPGGSTRPDRGPRPERRSRARTSRRRPSCRSGRSRSGLKPGRAHRNAVLADLPEEQRPVAERALQGGLPAVRQAVNEQNARLKAEGKPEVPAAGLLSMAEGLLPRLRVAEWLDRADAAKADIDELDLRDLRSVVAAGEDPMVARDETTRAVATELKAALVTKQEKRARPVVRRHRRRHRRRSCHPRPEAVVAAAEGRRALPHRARRQAGDGHHCEPHRRCLRRPLGRRARGRRVLAGAHPGAADGEADAGQRRTAGHRQARRSAAAADRRAVRDRGQPECLRARSRCARRARLPAKKPAKAAAPRPPRPPAASRHPRALPNPQSPPSPLPTRRANGGGAHRRSRASATQEPTPHRRAAPSKSNHLPPANLPPPTSPLRTQEPTPIVEPTVDADTHRRCRALRDSRARHRATGSREPEPAVASPPSRSPRTSPRSAEPSTEPIEPEPAWTASEPVADG